jgi:hypothetical protein
MSDEPWFRAKRFGYGAGLPLNWKGWAHLAVFVVVITVGNIAIQKYLPVGGRAPAMAIGAVVFVLPMLWLAARKTEGGWRWRI